MNKSDEEWKKTLTPEQYRILRKKETESPFTGAYLHNKEAGSYVCAACEAVLFESTTKFDSGSGWPSFYDVAKQGSVKLVDDSSHGMQRMEVICSKCNGHLGHLFDDAFNQPTGKRYCINSCSLDFKPAQKQ